MVKRREVGGTGLMVVASGESPIEVVGGVVPLGAYPTPLAVSSYGSHTELRLEPGRIWGIGGGKVNASALSRYSL